MIRRFAAALALAAVPAIAAAEQVSMESPHSVSETIDRLEAAVEGAGATIFARVDHAEGASSVDMELDPATLLIFGNPQLGTQVMQDDIRAGLVLPLRMLAYEWEGQTYLGWQSPEVLFDDLRVDGDAEYVQKIDGALRTLAEKAVSEE